MNKAQRDPKTGKWMIQYRYTDWQGVRRKTSKRGFDTKREAEAWLREFLSCKADNLTMSLNEFAELYLKDVEKRIRQYTMMKKSWMVRNRILPYLGQRRICDIKPVDVRNWQNEMISKGYSSTYLHALQSELSAIFNFAVKYYELPVNPCLKAGSIGKKESEEMKFWTQPEYLRFKEAMLDKPRSLCAFEMLYWCGLRRGELLALTPADFDFEKHTVSITKSLQRLHGRDVVTPPKTDKSVRVVTMPASVCDEMKDFIRRCYGLRPTDRIFDFTPAYLHHEMARGCKETGVKKIRIHDLRHSHVSLLIDQGFTPLAIAERVGHESIDITYRYAHLFPDKQGEMADRLDVLNRTDPEEAAG